MHNSLSSLLLQTAEHHPDNLALIFSSQSYTYGVLAEQVSRCASGLIRVGLKPRDRVAVYLPKSVENLISLFAVSLAGAIIVSVNPLLKPQQVLYILQNCTAKILVTSIDRGERLKTQISLPSDLRMLIVDSPSWHQLFDVQHLPFPQAQAQDPAAILYTSGSTGLPKGVVLSHQNLVVGAKSVRKYLQIRADDRLLLVLPLHFDYGFNQITTAFLAGASIVMMEYLFAQDVIRWIERFKVTGLACVPPLLMQLAELDWKKVERLRYITNSGGHLPVSVVKKITTILPTTSLFLMYGLTESFRSTYLPSERVLVKPESVGKAIPNAEVFILRPDGSECDTNETGELVHHGPLVSLGYWHNAVETRRIFKPLPAALTHGENTEIAVWSGDLAKKDPDGDITIIGRQDEQIKVSGYRVSPMEVEDVLYQHTNVREAVVFGIPEANVGNAIIALITIQGKMQPNDFMTHCKSRLPNYMLPSRIDIRESLPKTSTGKYDRVQLKKEYLRLIG